jgi:uncharacterized membrane protein YtjA (UPF0391 family)
MALATEACHTRPSRSVQPGGFTQGKGGLMLYYALVFLIIGLIAGVLGLAGVAAIAGQIAWILFVIGIVLLVIHLIRGRRVPPVV